MPSRTVLRLKASTCLVRRAIFRSQVCRCSGCAMSRYRCVEMAWAITPMSDLYTSIPVQCVTGADRPIQNSLAIVSIKAATKISETRFATWAI